ncbi:hypothetical protein HLB23_16780 [Nocardia uniformis]|uniref:MmpS family membrane protein n=1 Tax=Nocardia uniformis TaxID=53432 RepID=A0A849C9H5_9NOCA|nr:MmpS family transport accessory protein [Nocardia uniformis]NNH71499.1 hypothetical protein [Nocardia uniformis]
MAVQVPPTAAKPPVMPPHGRRRWPWIVPAVALLLVAGYLALASLADSQVRNAGGRETMVHYLVVGGGAGGSVTYTIGDSEVAQDVEVTLPWSREVAIKGMHRVPTLTAQNGSENTSISCRIRHGETVIAENSVHGPFAVASCSGPVDK